MSKNDELEFLSAELDRHAAELAEHFESVQILATRTIDNHTEIHMMGRGNWYARVGMANAFLQTDLSQYNQPPGEGAEQQ